MILPGAIGHAFRIRTRNKVERDQVYVSEREEKEQCGICAILRMTRVALPVPPSAGLPT